jgi:hypothetical protein
MNDENKKNKEEDHGSIEGGQVRVGRMQKEADKSASYKWEQGGEVCVLPDRRTRPRPANH